MFSSLSGETDSTSVSVQTNLHNDPEPAPCGGPEGHRHDEEKLFWEPQRYTGKHTRFQAALNEHWTAPVSIILLINLIDRMKFCIKWFLPFFVQANEKRISELRHTLSSLPPLDTEGQLSDILSYYHIITELRITTEILQVHTRAHTTLQVIEQIWSGGHWDRKSVNAER